MAGRMDANVARKWADLFDGGNRNKSVSQGKSTEEVKRRLPNAISSTRKQQRKEGCWRGRIPEAPGEEGGQRWGRALASPRPYITSSITDPGFFNQKGRRIPSFARSQLKFCNAFAVLVTWI